MAIVADMIRFDMGAMEDLEEVYDLFRKLVDNHLIPPPTATAVWREQKRKREFSTASEALDWAYDQQTASGIQHYLLPAAVETWNADEALKV